MLGLPQRETRFTGRDDDAFWGRRSGGECAQGNTRKGVPDGFENTGARFAHRAESAVDSSMATFRAMFRRKDARA